MLAAMFCFACFGAALPTAALPQSRADQLDGSPGSPPASNSGSASDERNPETVIRPGPGPLARNTHRFWDRENDLLFATVGAGRALDYASTLNLRNRGLDEAFLTNSIVDNHPLFAGIEAAATAASIGVSYIFHRTGHHSLERWTSIVHFGVATGGAIRNYALPTPH